MRALPEPAPGPVSPGPVSPGPVGAVLTYPAGSVVVVGGIPGAGKSTLIRRAVPTGVTTLDAETVRKRYQRRLSSRVPYRWYRPVVHLEFYLRLVVALLRPGTLVVHETATRRRARRAIAGLARLRHGRPHLLLLDTTVDDALRGQHERGRVVRPGSMGRHQQRWGVLRDALDVDPGALEHEGWAGTTVLDRRAAAQVQQLRFA